MISTPKSSSQQYPSGEKSAPRFFRPELDALRFVAFLLVFMCHATPGFSHAARVFKGACAHGVQVFFVLSAYLITEIMLRERDFTSTIDLRAFYIRRMLRIWPLYFLAIACACGLSYLRVLGEAPIPLAELACFLGLAGNWYSAFRVGLPYGFGVLWSISVEEQFYLVLPTATKYLNRRAIGIASIVMWVTSQIATIWLCTSGSEIHRVWLDSFVNLQFFAIGTYISCRLSGDTPAIPKLLRGSLALSGLCIFYVINLAADAPASVRAASLSIDYPRYLGAGLGSTLLFLSFLGARLPDQLRSTAALGKITYGLYVFHDACLLLCTEIVQSYFPSVRHLFMVKYFLGLPATIVVAKASYRIVERPFLHLKTKFEIVRSRPA